MKLVSLDHSDDFGSVSDRSFLQIFHKQKASLSVLDVQCDGPYNRIHFTSATKSDSLSL